MYYNLKITQSKGTPLKFLMFDYDYYYYYDLIDYV